MEDEVLITLVQNYEELYNLKHSQYSNLQRRDNIWEEIGDAMKLSAKTCRERWSRIRENYRKALNLRKTKSGQAAKKMKTPKYEKELSFLVPYLFDEETRHSNIASPTSQQNVASPTSQQNNASPPSLHSAESGSDIDETETVEQQSQLVDQSSSSLSTMSTINRRKRKYSQQAPTAAVVLKEYLDKKNTDTVEKNHPSCEFKRQDPLTEFFLTMADTVKGFPIREQIQIKAKLFEIVNSVEMKLADNEATDNEKQRSHNLLIPRGNISYNTLSATSSLSLSQAQHQIHRSRNNVLVVPQDNIPQESNIHYQNYNIPVQQSYQPTYCNLDSETRQ